MSVSKLMAVSFAIVALTACGSNVAKNGVTGSATTTTSGTDTSGTQTGSGGNIYNLPIASEFSAQINGASGVVKSMSKTFDTSRTLRVKVTPVSAPNLTKPGFSAWVFPYGCLRVQVSVNGITQTTQILKVDGAAQGQTSQCASAPTAQILDFTNSVSGADQITVTMSNAEYDNCGYTWPTYYGCKMVAINSIHEARAIISVQTDNTYLEPVN